MASQIWGLAPFPWPIPAIGACQVAHESWEVESPNVVLIWCCILCWVVIILVTIGWDLPRQLKHNAASKRVIQL